ncbi:MAG TPA: pantoate--beta-alanine ligase [Puia sp.]|nr:pantoate--beta-alanine ligase [Puia sp.]
MIIVKNHDQLKEVLAHRKVNGKTIGFVPTMGALHLGHIALLERAKIENSFVVCSIFINPTQFNSQADFINYPVTIEKDISLLESHHSDLLFLPSVAEVYPEGFEHLEHYNIGTIESVLEGKFRPGHFQGVCLVMSRLLKLIRPDKLYMGKKDYQQCLVVRRLIDILELSLELITVETVREPDGLAMSSRNLRLNERERKNATAIFDCLMHLRNTLHPGNLRSNLDEARTILEANEFKIDYIAIAGSGDLSEVTHWDGEQKLVALVAAFQHEIRLIDNILLFNEHI